VLGEEESAMGFEQGIEIDHVGIFGADARP